MAKYALDLLIPALLLFVASCGLKKQVNIYDTLITGAGEGLSVLLRVFPALVIFLPAVYMLRASGALELLSHFLSPLLKMTEVPPDLLPLMLIRPFSGSGALGVGAELIETFGPDSPVGLTAAVMLGATETTFYTISVYFGAVGISKTRYAIPAALCADLAGFFASAWAVRILLL